jgi:levansucrase
MAQHIVSAFESLAAPSSAVTRWTKAHVQGITHAAMPEASVYDASAAKPVIEGTYLWDIWPIQTDNGDVAAVAGGSLWVMLSAPRSSDPDARHDTARMRLLFKNGDEWHDCGLLLPDGYSPGRREWSGSTRLDLNSGQVTLWFTASGRPGSKDPDFEQRLFQATGLLDLSGRLPIIEKWRDLHESVTNDGTQYANLAETQGIPGRIKGFRDPYWFRDPRDEKGYILFTGSKSVATSQSDFDGVIGVAAANDIIGLADFTLMPRIVDADGLVNELERPHMIERDGNYYLFWSSQQSVFAPGTPHCPTGLYGMVGPSVFGPFEPLNGTGLVLANPKAEPFQAYAWQVLPTLEVVSFVDFWGLRGRDIKTDTALKEAQFGGTIAPVVKITLEGAKTRLLPDVI